jgi:hypothetical protein
LTLGFLRWLQGVGLQAVIQRDVKVLSEADTQAVMAYLRVFRWVPSFLSSNRF